MTRQSMKTRFITVIITVLILSLMGITGCQDHNKIVQTTETLVETIQIPDYGMAYVAVGDAQKLVSGKVTTDVNGNSMITDKKTGETYPVVAAQLIKEESFRTATVKDLSGQNMTVTGPVISTSRDGTTVILDPDTGTQYIVDAKAVTTETVKETTTSQEERVVQTKNQAENRSENTTVAPTIEITQEPTENYKLEEGVILSTDPNLLQPMINPDRTAVTTVGTNTAIPMSQPFIGDVLSEINRVRQEKGLNLLELDTLNPDYIKVVQEYANNLALRNNKQAENIPCTWALARTTDGTEAGKQFMESSSSVLNPTSHYVTIAAAQSAQTGDVYLVVSF